MTPYRLLAGIVVVGMLTATGACRRPPKEIEEVREQPAQKPEAPKPPPPAPTPEPKPAPEPRLLPQQQSADADEIRAQRQIAAELLRGIADRELTGSEAEKRSAAVAFLVQADEAFAAGDLTRSSVLIEKAVILLTGLRDDR